MSERKPLFSRSRIETTERADGALTWTFGSLYGLHEEVVGVGLTFINPTALADVHFTTTYSISPLSVKEKRDLLVTILHPGIRRIENSKTYEPESLKSVRRPAKLG